MTVIKRTFGLMSTVSAAIIVLAPDSHAYIDPSTGSYILQILMAGLLGALFALKVFWRNVRAFVARFLGKSTQDNVKTD